MQPVLFLDTCPGGEIGRRTTLRWWRWKRRAGSNPVSGTGPAEMRGFFYYFHFMSPFQKIIRDPSVWGLLAMNLAFIYLYRNDATQYTTVVWLYWCQSVLLGVFNFFDMLTVKSPDVSNFTINNKPATQKQAKGCLPFFFLFHYGIFHFVYIFFLVTDFKISDIDFSYWKWALAALFINQVVLFIQNKNFDREKPRHITGMFFTPYLRIVPMHLTILAPQFLGWTPALTFLVLKTIFDLAGHIISTPYYWNRESQVSKRYFG